MLGAPHEWSYQILALRYITIHCDGFIDADFASHSEQQRRSKVRLLPATLQRY